MMTICFNFKTSSTPLAKRTPISGTLISGSTVSSIFEFRENRGTSLKRNQTVINGNVLWFKTKQQTEIT